MKAALCETFALAMIGRLSDAEYKLMNSGRCVTIHKKNLSNVEMENKIIKWKGM
jgi:hypothetical protein